jgi:hypothetical protein
MAQARSKHRNSYKQFDQTARISHVCDGRKRKAFVVTTIPKDTFLLTDWFKHAPNEVLSKNFGVPGSSFAHVPEPIEMYIFAASVPGSLDSDKIAGAIPVSPSFSHKMLAQQPIAIPQVQLRVVAPGLLHMNRAIAYERVQPPRRSPRPACGERSESERSEGSG